MTVLRRDREAISNYFDRVLKGIGKRGSTFSDVDAVSHDELTDRFLFQEFKQPYEELSAGQSRLLAGLARQEWITVWCVRRREDEYLDWCDIRTGQRERLTLDEYRYRYQCWWERRS